MLNIFCFITLFYTSSTSSQVQTMLDWILNKGLTYLFILPHQLAQNASAQSAKIRLQNNPARCMGILVAASAWIWFRSLAIKRGAAGDITTLRGERRGVRGRVLRKVAWELEYRIYSGILYAFAPAVWKKCLILPKNVDTAYMSQELCTVI